MKKLTTLLKTLLVVICLGGGGNVWADTTTLLEYGTTNVPWTTEKAAEWTGKTLTLANDNSYVMYVGTDNGDFANTKEIAPTEGTIINVTAVWRARSNTGRYWSNNCGIYFRYGNIVVAQNDQDKSHAYTFSGLLNLTSATKFTAGSYRADIENCTWLKIEAEINTATNTLTSFTIKSEDGVTTYVSQTNIVLEKPDYTTVAFGFQRGGSHNTEKQEQLKSIKITQTTQSAKYADYTVHFVDGDGAKLKEDVVRSGEVGEIVRAIPDDKNAFFIGDDKYGYSNDGDGVTVKEDGTSVLTVTYSKLGQYTYTVYAVDKSGNQLATLATATAFSDEEKALTWSKYVKIGDQWYVTAETEFTTTANAAGSRNVVYTPSDIAYFFEMEGLTRSGGAYLTETTSSYSGNLRIRLSKGSTYYTPALAGGVYLLQIGCANSNASSNEVYVYTRDSEGILSDTLYTHTATNGTTTLKYVITVPEGYSIAFNGNEGNYNNNARMDYMILTEFKEAKTITSAGYATLCSEYPLNFEGTGLTAYVAVVNGEKVEFNPVTTIPANTGVLLKGAEGTYQIPAVMNPASVENNAFIGVTEKTVAPVGSFVLMGTPEVGFYKTTKAFTVGAGTAYLPATASARTFIGFDDEATGIVTVERNSSRQADVVYTLGGQRVEKAVKGFYIQGGKKYVVK